MTEKERDELLIRLDERMNNHLHWHEKQGAKLTRGLIAVIMLLVGLIGNGILMWIIK